MKSRSAASSAFTVVMQGHVVKADVVLASHEALVSDVSVLRAISWEAVIMDERERVPSALAKAFQAAREMEMRLRIVLQSSPLAQVILR